MNALNKKYIIVYLVLFALIIVTMYQANSDIPFSSHSKTADTNMHLGNLEFKTSLEQAAELASDGNKMLFVYLRSETCGWCKKFEAESFMDDNITSLLNEHFILLTIDIYNQKNIAIRMGVRNTPTSLFYSTSGKEILRIPGYEDKAEFLNDIQKLTGGTPRHLQI